MVAFFASLTIIGITIILISIFLVMLDRKRDIEEKEEYISIKNNLRELLEDSNQMIDELNRFSDYVVSKVDEKCSEFMNIINELPEDKEKVVIKDNHSRLESNNNPIPVINESVILPEIEKEVEHKEDIDSIEQRPPIILTQENSNVSMNQRHNEVMRLFESGMTDNDIAKTLNMGKGEVQLIVGMNLHKIKLQ